MAQLVAHHTGSVGVRGSSPLSSTRENAVLADYSEPFDDNFDDNGLVFDDNWLVEPSPTCANKNPIESSASRCTASITSSRSRGHRDRAVAQDPLHRRCLHAHREEQGGAGVPQIMHAKLRHVGISHRRWNIRLTLRGSMKPPTTVVNTRPVSRHCEPASEPFFQLPFPVSPHNGHQRSRDRQYGDRRVRFHVVNSRWPSTR